MKITNKNIYVAKGNYKIGKDTLVFSLPAAKTCPHSTTMCRHFCYAKQAELQYKEVLPSRTRNFNETKKEDFVKDMVNTIKCKVANAKKEPIKYFRIHESGDFYSSNYFEKWLQIIEQIPNVQFLAFTKSSFVKEYLDRLPANLNLYYSVWADTKKENIIYELPLALAGDCKHLYDKDTFECTGNCYMCHHCFTRKSDVHFHIHGNKAQKK